MTASAPSSAETDVPGFDEEEYLRRYPDVVRAIAEGKFASGQEHFRIYGRAEGRQWSASLMEAVRATFGPVRDFAAPPPNLPRSAIDALTINEAGWLFVVGWADDAANPISELKVEGRDWTLRIAGRALARIARGDVQKALGSGAHRSAGFMALVEAGGRLQLAGECRVTIVLSSGHERQLMAPARNAGLRELRDQVLGFIAASAAASSQIPSMMALESGLGAQMIALSRAANAELTATPFVERFGEPPARPKGSIVVCLYGRPEYIFVQNALFAGKPGIEDYEFVYVCNSPELLERLCKEAACGRTIYGIAQTIVGLPGNAGFGAANNLAVQQAQSDRILCLNPDVLPRDVDWARRHTDVIDSKAPGRRLFGGALYYDDGALMHGGMYFELDGGLAIRPRHVETRAFARVEHYGKGAPPETAAFLRARPVPAVSGAFLSIDRAWFERLGGFSPDYVLGHYEDADLCLRSLDAGTPAWVQEIKMWHLEGRGSVQQQAHAGAMIVNRWLFSRLWRDRIAAGLQGPSPRLAPVAEAAE